MFGSLTANLVKASRLLFRGKPNFLIRFNSELCECLNNHKIIPDVIDSTPCEVAGVCYDCPLEMSHELTPAQVKNIPCVSWCADSCEYYTLLMLDPDAPSPYIPKEREWHHWFVGNIPGDKVGKGDTIYQYVGAWPCKGSGLHRYIFLIYHQPCPVDFCEERLCNQSACGRGNNCARSLSCKYNLGEPIAINFFQAKWDCYVPILMEQLGIEE